VDFEMAEFMLTRMAQGHDFVPEIKELANGKEVGKSSALLKLTPFLDGDGMLRVGDRIGRSELPL
jgi:hypothetical protein